MFLPTPRITVASSWLNTAGSSFKAPKPFEIQPERRGRFVATE